MKRKRHLLLLLLGAVLMSFSALSIISCEEKEEPDTITTRCVDIDIINETSETLYVDGYSREEYLLLDHYFDTLLSRKYFPGQTYIIPPKEKKGILVLYYTFNEIHDDNTNVWIKVVRRSTVERHSIEEIRENNINDGIYRFSLGELKKMGGVFVIRDNK